MVFLSENAILGDSGNNLLVGTSEQDLIFGLAGLDSVFGAESGDILFGGSGEDVISGHQGADTLYGGQDNDLLYGGIDKDFLFGDQGADTLYGDRGIDCLTGGAGADLFVVGDGSGGPTDEDVILDFNFVEDQIEVKDGLTFDDLLIEDHPVGENTVIRRRDTEVILAVLPGVEAANLTAANFLAEDAGTDETTDETTGEAISRSDSEPINPEPDVTPVPTPTPEPEPDPVDVTPEPEPEPDPIEETDTLAPEIEISLQNDTGVSGDLVTADPSISGTITDDNQITAVTVGLDDTPVAEFTDILDRLNENQQFVLTPAILEEIPEFYVYIDGSGVENTPEGTQYASLGKAFHSVPGEAIQLEMDGEPFNIYLPTMAEEDIVTLSETEETQVGFGAASIDFLTQQFPNIDPALCQETQVTFAAGSAQDDAGNAATQAMIVPVDPERLPAPLPPNVDPGLVISIQAGSENGLNRETEGGATNFDVPAPVTFPNIEGLAPGEKSLIWSFDHDAGNWVVIGTGTVSEDGLRIISDEGVGVLAPGVAFCGNRNTDLRA